MDTGKNWTQECETQRFSDIVFIYGEGKTGLQTKGMIASCPGCQHKLIHRSLSRENSLGKSLRQTQDSCAVLLSWPCQLPVSYCSQYFNLFVTVPVATDFQSTSTISANVFVCEKLLGTNFSKIQFKMSCLFVMTRCGWTTGAEHTDMFWTQCRGLYLQWHKQHNSGAVMKCSNGLRSVSVRGSKSAYLSRPDY